MTATFTNSEFPKDENGRTYHIGIRVGEIANRLLTVGDVHRVEMLEKYLNPIYFRYVADRGFLTVTGAYNGVPITIQSSLMGYPNLDFQIRENIACVRGTLVVIRFGTCGTPNPGCNVGELALATVCRGIYRNPDAFRTKEEIEEEVKLGTASSPSSSTPLQISPEKYHVTLPTYPDPELFARTKETLLKIFPTANPTPSAASPSAPIPADTTPPPAIRIGLNFSGCTFYSSQGRASNEFEDDNAELVNRLVTYPTAMSIEMETFHLFDLAKLSRGRLRAGGTHIILAKRDTHQFITPVVKEARVNAYGEALLKVLAEFPIADADLMKGDDCVWQKK